MRNSGLTQFSILAPHIHSIFRQAGALDGQKADQCADREGDKDEKIRGRVQPVVQRSRANTLKKLPSFTTRYDVCVCVCVLRSLYT